MRIKGTKPNRNMILLESVGTYINKRSGWCYPAYLDGSYDDKNKTFLFEFDNEWLKSLNKRDENVFIQVVNFSNNFKPMIRNIF